MIAFPSMLVDPAEKAGIKVPDDPDIYDIKKYPHWHIFLNMQLGSPMPYPAAHWDNAKVIAKIPDDKVNTITVGEIKNMGFVIGFSKP